MSVRLINEATCGAATGGAVKHGSVVATKGMSDASCYVILLDEERVEHVIYQVFPEMRPPETWVSDLVHMC